MKTIYVCLTLIILLAGCGYKGDPVYVEKSNKVGNEK
jgi:predicted small lipoprotein YifL